MIRSVGKNMKKITGTAACFCGLWVKCKARKSQHCVLSGKIIPIGSDQYRPITNGVERMQRIAADVMEKYVR